MDKTDEPAPAASGTVDERFSAFFVQAEPRLRRALVASLGPVRGREAAAEALAWAWERWDQVEALDHPLGYLYRVGQSRSRARRQPVIRGAVAHHEDWFEPKLTPALDRLSERQRTHREVAELTGLSISSVQNHLERGLSKLRKALGDP
jgi:DNA-directed RNA polymerase specialized sigma24 family protein